MKETPLLEALKREIISYDWITILLIASFLLLVLLKVFSENRLKGYIASYKNNGFLEIEAEKNRSFFSVFHIIYFLYSLIIFSLTIFLFINIRDSNRYPLTIESYLPILISIVFYFLIRFSVEKALLKVYRLDNHLSFFMFSKRGYLYSFSTILFTVILLYVYGFNNSTFFLVSVYFLLAVRIVLLFLNNKKLIINKLFYFILYICTFEIIPLLVFLKNVIF